MVKSWALTEREGENSLLDEEFTGNSWDCGLSDRNLRFFAQILDTPDPGEEEKSETVPTTAGDAAEK